MREESTKKKKQHTKYMYGYTKKNINKINKVQKLNK